MYQPWYSRPSLPPYCPYLATSSISHNHKVNANNNGQCSKKHLFVTFSRQICQINKVLHPMTSSSEWRQVRLRLRESPSHCGIAQLVIQKEACSREMRKYKLLKQRTERKLDQGLYRERDRCGNKASWRRRGRSSAREGWYKQSWRHRINEQRARKDTSEDVGRNWRQSV